MLSCILIFALGLSATQACCPPKAWETLAFDMKSFASKPVYRKTAHDDERRIESYVYYSPDNKLFSQHFIRDFNTNILWTFNSLKPEDCTAEDLTDTFISRDDCLNGRVADMKVDEPVTVGVAPTTQLMERVSFSVNGANIYMGMLSAAGKDYCFPVMATVSFPDGSPYIDRVMAYFNSTTVITSGIFDVPDACRNKFMD